MSLGHDHRRLAAAGLLTGALLTSGCTVAQDGEALPEVTVVEFGDDRPVELASLRGPMVLNLWASYCTPCRREMPVLQDFHEQYGDEVEVVGLDYQDPQRAKAEQLVADTGATYRLLADEGGDVNGVDPLPNIQGLPLTVLVDEDGRVAFLEYGEVSSVAELEDLVGEHLGVDL
jgi:cytochrome c biogenesis protein CcmG, thiol:disulfide interchange protein DsbE